MEINKNIQSVEILHNPRCGKSRESMELLKNLNYDISVREYLKNPLNKEELKRLLSQLKIKPIQLARTNEPLFKELFPSGLPTDAKLISSMVKFPILIERPIVIYNGKAIIGRPPAFILDLFK
jgi:arsenate reductase (glutaredoxin)